MHLYILLFCVANCYMLQYILLFSFVKHSWFCAAFFVLFFWRYCATKTDLIIVVIIMLTLQFQQVIIVLTMTLIAMLIPIPYMNVHASSETHTCMHTICKHPHKQTPIPHPPPPLPPILLQIWFYAHKQIKQVQLARSETIEIVIIGEY